MHTLSFLSVSLSLTHTHIKIKTEDMAPCKLSLIRVNLPPYGITLGLFRNSAASVLLLGLKPASQRPELCVCDLFPLKGLPSRDGQVLLACLFCIPFDHGETTRRGKINGKTLLPTARKIFFPFQHENKEACQLSGLDRRGSQCSCRGPAPPFSRGSSPGQDFLFFL